MGWTSTDAILCYVIGVAGVLAFQFIEWRMGEEAVAGSALANKTIGIGSIA